MTSYLQLFESVPRNTLFRLLMSFVWARVAERNLLSSHPIQLQYLSYNLKQISSCIHLQNSGKFEQSSVKGLREVSLSQFFKSHNGLLFCFWSSFCPPSPYCSTAVKKKEETAVSFDERSSEIRWHHILKNYPHFCVFWVFRAQNVVTWQKKSMRVVYNS